MSVLSEAVTRLGLLPQVEELARFEAAAARAAMDAPWEGALEDGEPDPGFANRADYVTSHGLRAAGLLALFDQVAAVELGDALERWLRQAAHPAWPLAAAFAAAASLSDPGHPRTAELITGAGGYPADLARLLVDPLGLRDATPVPATGAGRRWSRAGLAPYRIDVRVLQCVVRGPAAGGATGLSEPSAPAVLAATFGSLEDALAEVRVDGYHWDRGVSPVQATDPEVVVAVRAVLRSPAEGALRHLPTELPMVSAVIDLVDAIEAVGA